jgi:hypothetical protein
MQASKHFGVGAETPRISYAARAGPSDPTVIQMSVPGHMLFRNRPFDFYGRLLNTSHAKGAHIRQEAQQGQRQPAISVDTKKKETLGKRKNPAAEWRPKRKPREVTVHDFPDPRKGKAVPYGVYDLSANEAWVSVGVSSDTAEFAVETIRAWWKRLGRRRHPHAQRLLITADSGGSM